ncbi:MAG TPA: DNA mismatch repair endonuclease MutL [Bacteroidales bacterium]|nr:DNA mismatch repair endonuclease MutL [Bacteroidales bacterium]
MSDIIKLLPDSVANQIAAGEVVQRPSSVVKELVENSIDAGASNIQVVVKDAGKTSIQVIDNGCGMSPMDARMAFERHATSKITEAKDLFAIQTLGFRGEALASIAAVAEVKLRTKRIEDELGTAIDIAASEITMQEATVCANGTNFTIRNLFFNVPARRKFLKVNNTELKHIINEFQRVALTHPEIEFSLNHNNVDIYHLPQSNFRQRICNVFGKTINQHLVPINADTSIVKISGFIGKPEAAKKTFGEQFFFVNGRFIKHPYLHKAVLKAYDQLLPNETLPSYFIYFNVDPETIDINIHPTKTEVKFEDEQSIYQILLASLRESLGKFNIAPSLDFTIDTSIDIPVARKDGEIKQPVIDINPFYNPFDNEKTGGYSSPRMSQRDIDNSQNWDKLYSGFEQSGFTTNRDDDVEAAPVDRFVSANTSENSTINTLQLKNKYILTPVKSGLMVIDQKRAHERILFEQFMGMVYHEQSFTQQSLFPEVVEFTVPEIQCIKEIGDDIRAFGFDFEVNNDSEVVIKGYPSDSSTLNVGELFKDIVHTCMDDTANDIKLEKREKIAIQMAKSAAVPYGKSLTHEEMRNLVDHLFACEMPNFTPSGKSIISILTMDEIEKRL